MNKVFETISAWIDTSPDGWTSKEAAHIFAACSIALRPEVAVEIGVWGGRSLIPVALAMKEVGRGTIIGIDPWSATASIQGMEGENLAWWSNQMMHDQVYNRCIESIHTLGVQNCVKIVRKSSNDVQPPERIDWLNVDGNHGPQAENDITRFASKVRIGGMCFCDDLGWDGGAVARGVELLKTMGFVQLYTVEKGAMFQRVK